jgi:hypothetical protein
MSNKLAFLITITALGSFILSSIHLVAWISGKAHSGKILKKRGI